MAMAQELRGAPLTHGALVQRFVTLRLGGGGFLGGEMGARGVATHALTRRLVVGVAGPRHCAEGRAAAAGGEGQNAARGESRPGRGSWADGDELGGAWRVEKTLREFQRHAGIEEASTPPSAWYTDAEFADYEMDRVFGRGWQAVGNLASLSLHFSS